MTDQNQDHFGDLLERAIAEAKQNYMECIILYVRQNIKPDFDSVITSTLCQFAQCISEQRPEMTFKQFMDELKAWADRPDNNMQFVQDNTPPPQPHVFHLGAAQGGGADLITQILNGIVNQHRQGPKGDGN